MSYNGWKNYETWNVALWIGNDETLYRAACAFMTEYEGEKPYEDFVHSHGLAGNETPDGVRWLSSDLSTDELDRMMRELVE